MNNGNNRQWEEVSQKSDNQRWEPFKTHPIVTQGQEPWIMGYYKKNRQINGRKGIFSVAEIHTVNEAGIPTQVFDVSGGGVLDDKLAEIPLGSFVLIKYLGKVQSKSTGNGYNNWAIAVDKNAVPYAQVMEKVNNLPPVAQGQQFNNAAPASQQGTFNPNVNSAVPASQQNATLPPAPNVFGNGQQTVQGGGTGNGFFGGNTQNPPPF